MEISIAAVVLLTALFALLRWQRQRADAEERAKENRRTSLVRRLAVGQFHYPDDDGGEVHLHVDFTSLVATRRVDSRAGVLTSDWQIRRRSVGRWEMRPTPEELARSVRRLNEEHHLPSDDDEHSRQLPEASRQEYLDRFRQLMERPWRLLPDEVARSIDSVFNQFNEARGVDR